MLRRGLYMPWELPEVMDPDTASKGLRDLRPVAALNETASRVSGNERLAISALEMSYYMRNQLLNDADWASMAQSIEIRVPLADVQLLRKAAPWLATHPTLTKVQVAAFTCPNLSRELVDRKKTGFQVPTRTWLTNPQQRNTRQRGVRDWAQLVHGPAIARP